MMKQMFIERVNEEGAVKVRFKGYWRSCSCTSNYGLGEIYQYVVRTKPGFEQKYDITELRTIQDWIVRRQLLSVEGVAEVSSFGGKLKQFEYNDQQTSIYNVTI
jgi:Cu/Ag efflux pump CusA